MFIPVRFKPCHLLGTLLITTATLASAQSVLLWSTQATPPDEFKAMKDNVLANAPDPVEFASNQSGPFITRLGAELKAGKGSIGVVGALHGDIAPFAADMINLTNIPGADKANKTFLQLGKLGTAEQKYVPWMQATFVMVANKKALPYLPSGADVNKLSYDQLIQWAKNMAEKTGGPKFGFPAGPKGLKHRFFQGYLYPSYTDSVVTEFRSPKAAVAWEKFKELWKYTNPASTNYNVMEEQLGSGEVWVAFDHIARLAGALNAKPNDFVAFPAPAGPTGRGFMPVLAGLSIPKTAPDQAKARALIAHLLKPQTQLATLKATNFFPVVDMAIPADMPPSVKLTHDAMTLQSTSSDAKVSLLPTGLGALGGKFNQVYIDTFERIVLANQPVQEVLNEQAAALRAIMKEANAACWAPDKSPAIPCPVN